jgi:hypothetical protein
MVKEIYFMSIDLERSFKKMIVRFFPHRIQEQFYVAVRVYMRRGKAYNIAVECTAQSPVGGYHHQQNLFNAMFTEQGIPAVLDAGHQMSDGFAQLACIGPGGEDICLGSAQLRGSHHFHGFGDLLGTAYAGDAPTYFT